MKTVKNKTNARSNSSCKSLIAYGCINFILLIALVLLSINRYIVSANMETAINKDSTSVVYHTLEEIYAQPEEFIGTANVICGYMCQELATDTGLAWLTDTKETSKDNAQYVIRLEQTNPFTYSPQAIAVYGTLMYSEEEKALYISNPQLYKYAGTDKKMLEHNELLDAKIIPVIMSSLQYDNTQDFTQDLNVIDIILNNYEDTSLLDTIYSIRQLVSKKNEISKEQFETEAEQLWYQFTAQLLDRENTNKMEGN